MNAVYSVNIKSLSRGALGKMLLAKLHELLDGISWLGDWTVQSDPSIKDKGFDFMVKIPLPSGGKAELWVQCKADPRPSLFSYTHLASEVIPPPVQVLAAPLVSPRLAGVCEERGWSWFDLAGNHRLDVPGLLHLQHTGNEAVHKRQQPTVNLGTREAGRIIRTLLVPENAGMRWTQREMQKRCQPNVSLGLVNKVVSHLRDEAFIESAQDGGFRLRDPLKLLFEWRDAYRFDRHERRGYFTLLQGKKLRDALAGLGVQSGGFVAYAAFSAAEYQAPHVRQPKTWLYVREQEDALFEQCLEAKRVDSGENLVVLIPNDEGIFYLGDGGTGDNRMSCTNSVQTYVDLYHCGGRGKEAAEALLNQCLKPEWKRRELSI